MNSRKLHFRPYIFEWFSLWSLDFIFPAFHSYLKKQFPLWSLPLYQRRKKHAWQMAKLKKYYNTLHMSWDAPRGFHQENNDLQGRHLSFINVSSEDDSLLFNSSFSESLHHSFSGSKSTTFFFIFELLCMKVFFFFGFYVWVNLIDLVVYKESVIWVFEKLSASY